MASIYIGFVAAACGARSPSGSGQPDTCSDVAMEAAIKAPAGAAQGPCAPPASLLRFVSLAAETETERGPHQQQAMAEATEQHVGLLKHCGPDLFNELALAEHSERAALVGRACNIVAAGDGATVEVMIVQAAAMGWAMEVGADWPQALRDRVSAWILAALPAL